jgi:hypothetical protein
LVVVAVNVTEAPVQVGLLPDVTAIETVGATVAVLLKVIELEVANEPVVHVALDVISHVTTSPFANELPLNVVLFVPAFTPLTFH